MHKRISALIVLSIVYAGNASAVEPNAGATNETPNAIEWLFRDLGALFQVSGDDKSATKPEAKADAAPKQVAHQDSVVEKNSAVEPEPTPDAATPFRNPLAALFKDLAAFFEGAGNISEDANARPELAGPSTDNAALTNPMEITDGVEDEEAPDQSRTVTVTLPRNPFSWLLADVKSLVHASNSGTETNATPVVADASNSDANEEDQKQTKTLTSSDESTASVSDDVPANEAISGFSELEAGPWLYAEGPDLFDPSADARRGGIVPATEISRSLDIVSAAFPVDDVAVDEPDVIQQTVVRKRVDTDPVARNHRSLGRDAAGAPADEPNFFENVVNLVMGKSPRDDTPLADTVRSEEIASRVPDRIIPEEELDLGSVSTTSSIPDDLPPSRANLGGDILRDIDLFVGTDTVIGTTYNTSDHAPNVCLDRPTHVSVFCLRELSWPSAVADSFALETAYAKPGEAVLRFENGKLSRVYSGFRAADFADVVKLMQKRFGPPQERDIIWMHMIGAPKLPNTTFRWKALTADRRDVIVLEVRNYDDLRRSFADTERGMVRLFRDGSRPIFKHLTTMDLMLIQRRRIARAPVEINTPPAQ